MKFDSTHVRIHGIYKIKLQNSTVTLIAVDSGKAQTCIKVIQMFIYSL
jgi:hypothetical protein